MSQTESSPTVRRDEFEALVKRHHAEVYRSAWSLLRREEDAQDVTQEVFLRVLEGKVRLDEARDTARLLRWVAARTALMHLRKEKSLRRREERVAMETNEAITEGPECPDGIGTVEERRVVTRLLNRLREELRIPVLLRFREGMTYKSIAEALGVSEATAHERVRRGVDRLKTDLSRAGFAALVPSFEAILPASEPAPVPLGLESKLLALKPAAGLAGFASGALLPTLLLGGGVLAVVALAYAWQGGGRRASDATTTTVERPAAPSVASGFDERATDDAGSDSAERRAVGDPDRGVASASTSADRADANAGSDASAALGHGFLTGRIVDRHGGPVAGVEVVARSVERQKVAAFTERTTSESDGSFRLAVPVRPENDRRDGQGYHLVTRHDHYLSEQSDPLPAFIDEETSPVTITVYDNSNDVAGSYVLSLVVEAPDRRPVPGVGVSISRRVLNQQGNLIPEQEDRGETDETGRIELQGEWLGEKLVLVDARRLGYRLSSTDLGIARGGLSDARVALEQGLVIAGVLRDTAGRPVTDAWPVAIDPKGRTTTTGPRADADGSFRIAGLSPGVHVLRVTAHEWSPAQVGGIEAGREDLELTLKRRDDPRDRGLHMAEIHGRVRVEGGGVEDLVARNHVSWSWIEPGEAESFRTDVLPNLLGLRAQQEMDPGPTEPSDDFHLVGIRPGTYAVAARVQGFAPTIVGPFELDADDLVNDVELVVGRGWTLRGRTVGPDGATLFGAVAFVTGTGARSDRVIEWRDETERERGAPHPDRIDADGRFELTRLPAGVAFRVVAVHADYEPAVSRTTVSGPGSGEVVLRFERRR